MEAAGAIAEHLARLFHGGGGGDGDIDVSALRQMHQVLEGCVTKHIYPPTALGSRHSNTSHKFAALLHGLRLECESWLDVQGVLGMYFAMTTDAVVEKKVLQAQVDSPTALFRYWLPHLSMHGGDELRAGAAATTAEQTQQQEQNAFADQLSMRAILHIPGGFHIVENVVARLLDMLPSWAEAIKPGLEAVCFVFHSRFSRERFVEQCLVGDRAAWKGLFSSGPPTFKVVVCGARPSRC